MNLALQLNYNPMDRLKGTGTMRSIRYSFKPTEKMDAKFEGDKARCGNCNSVLGEFKSADGEIKCRKNDCKVINVVKKNG